MKKIDLCLAKIYKVLKFVSNKQTASNNFNTDSLKRTF